MQKAISVVTMLCVLCTATRTGHAVENTKEYSVQLSARAQTTPPQLTLTWPQDGSLQPKSYSVYRKASGSSSWGRPTLLPGTATSYIDKNVQVGASYEYQVVKSTQRYNGFGYVYAGINATLEDKYGKLLLIVDNTYATELKHELNRLQMDLVGDGWGVTRMEVARTEPVVNIKARIKAEFERDPENVKGVFLFGHVPVPYSGDIVPDGHAPDHQGAWPCDGYYADMDGLWTDNWVNDTSAADPRNRNVPGDGKYDQSTFPAPLKLMIGRVDLANMPGRLTCGGAATFPGELELLRNYLNKDHAFRTKQFDLPRRGLVGDYFGIRDGEAFAASGWRNLASFFAADNISTLGQEGTWIPTLRTNSYLWAYGCGPGSFTSIGGLGNSDAYHDGVTTELYRNDLKAAFTMLFGSWLGDWDSEDNLQRAVLALPSYGLTCVCSGRPHWFMQHMALGKPIGFSTRLTQNNRKQGLYQNEANNCTSLIHIALMGDPTLRMHVVAPPGPLNARVQGKELTLSWTASEDDVVGYHIYRSPSLEEPFARLTDAPIPQTTFVINRPETENVYMVRAIKLETSASGTYFNASQGVFSLPETAASLDTVATTQGSPSTLGLAANQIAKLEAIQKSPKPTGSSSSSVRAPDAPDNAR